MFYPTRHAPQFFSRKTDIPCMKRAARKNLKTALSIAIFLLVGGGIFFLVAKFAPEDPFVDSGFVQDVGKVNRY